MEPFYASLALCEENSPAIGEFPSQRPVTRSFDVFFDMPEQTAEQTIAAPVIWDVIALSMWRHCNVNEKQTRHRYIVHITIDVHNTTVNAVAQYITLQIHIYIAVINLNMCHQGCSFDNISR